MAELVSRFLQTLSERIAAAQSQVERDCLLADYAAHWARMGKISDSEKLILTLRNRYNTNLVDGLAIRINLAEGLIHHFRDLDILAVGKVRQAYVMSEAACDLDLISTTSAWLAHMEYVSGRVEPMVKHIHRTLATASPENSTALSRVSIVAADALHLAGRIDLARPWYKAAHFYANKEGDEATISALMHNMAWLRSANLRQKILSAQGNTPSGEFALMSTESIENYDEIVGTNSLLSLVPILKAQVLSLLGRYADALQLFETHLPSAIAEGLLRMKCCLLADQAWCRIQLADTAGATSDAELAASSINAETHTDDKASTHSRLANVYRLLGREGQSQKHADLARAAWDSHCSLQALILTKLETLTPIRVA